jgi:hypothetical protein
MSQVKRIETTPPVQEINEMDSTASLGNDVTAEDNQAGSTHARRIVIQANVSADDLQAGHIVSVPNAMDVFKPSYDMEKLDESQKDSMQKLDFQKGIVTGIKLKSVYSNVAEPVSVGVKLFSNKPQITNNEGWLFTEANTDMGKAHTSETDGYVNLVSVLPYEKSRPNQEV